MSNISFAPSGIETREQCPRCDEMATLEHGIAYDGDAPIGCQHYWHCPECGDSMAIVCYDCPHCVPDGLDDPDK
jgi:hypothetical protein